MERIELVVTFAKDAGKNFKLKKHFKNINQKKNKSNI